MIQSHPIQVDDFSLTPARGALPASVDAHEESGPAPGIIGNVPSKLQPSIASQQSDQVQNMHRALAAHHNGSVHPQGTARTRSNIETHRLKSTAQANYHQPTAPPLPNAAGLDRPGNPRSGQQPAVDLSAGAVGTSPRTNTRATFPWSPSHASLHCLHEGYPDLNSPHRSELHPPRCVAPKADWNRGVVGTKHAAAGMGAKELGGGGPVGARVGLQDRCCTNATAAHPELTQHTALGCNESSSVEAIKLTGGPAITVLPAAGTTKHSSHSGSLRHSSPRQALVLPCSSASVDRPWHSPPTGHASTHYLLCWMLVHFALWRTSNLQVLRALSYRMFHASAAGWLSDSVSFSQNAETEHAMAIPPYMPPCMRVCIASATCQCAHTAISCFAEAFVRLTNQLYAAYQYALAAFTAALLAIATWLARCHNKKALQRHRQSAPSPSGRTSVPSEQAALHTLLAETVHAVARPSGNSSQQSCAVAKEGSAQGFLLDGSDPCIQSSSSVAKQLNCLLEPLLSPCLVRQRRRLAVCWSAATKWALLMLIGSIFCCWQVSIRTISVALSAYGVAICCNLPWRIRTDVVQQSPCQSSTAPQPKKASCFVPGKLAFCITAAAILIAACVQILGIAGRQSGAIGAACAAVQRAAACLVPMLLDAAVWLGGLQVRCFFSNTLLPYGRIAEPIVAD